MSTTSQVRDNRFKFALWIFFGALAAAILMYFLSAHGRSSNFTEDKSYYSGPILNHNGDLVDEHGVILKRHVGGPMKRPGR